MISGVTRWNAWRAWKSFTADGRRAPDTYPSYIVELDDHDARVHQLLSSPESSTGEMRRIDPALVAMNRAMWKTILERN